MSWDNWEEYTDFMLYFIIFSNILDSFGHFLFLRLAFFSTSQSKIKITENWIFNFSKT